MKRTARNHSIAALAAAMLLGAAWAGSVRAAAPSLDPISNMTIASGGCSPSTADQAIRATDADGDAIVFTSSGPSWMTVTGDPQVGTTRTGNIHLVSPPSGTTGNFPASVTATAGGESDTKSFVISVIQLNQGPVLNQPSNMTVNEGQTADQTITGADPCAAPLTFVKVAGPTYMTVTTINATTGNIHLAPGLTDAGTATATVRATNGVASADRSFLITVNMPDQPPLLAQPSNMTVDVGATADQTLFATNPSGSPLTFSKVSGPAFMTVTTVTATTGNVHLAPSFSDVGTYAATVAVTDGVFVSQKSFLITVNSSCRTTLIQPANMTVSEGSTADQTIVGTDPDGRPQTFSKVSGPLFMTVTTLDAHTGDIHLAPSFSDAGTYSASVRATNDCFGIDTKSFTIFVNQVCSGAPVAQSGGPYSGFVGVPVPFDGSGSSDPAGSTLSFTWDFGDGSTGTGVMPLHTYTTLGTFLVTLSVTGECGSSSSSTTATIQAECDAVAFTSGGNRTVRLNSQRSTCVQIEPESGCYRNEDVILSSIVMRYAGGAVPEIHAIADKTVINKDTDGDGLAEITACFRKEDLRQLFSGLPGGTSTVTVAVGGDLTTGGRFQGTLDLRVIATGGGTAVTVAPNPFNPAGTLTFATSRRGSATVEIFDVGGRLVRTLLHEPDLSPGFHDVAIDGRDRNGESLASGIYFVRGVTTEGTFTRTVTILK